MSLKAERLGEDIIYTVVDFLVDYYHDTNVGYKLSLNRHWRRALLGYPKSFSSHSLTLTNRTWPPSFPEHLCTNLLLSSNRISNLNLSSDYFNFCRLVAHFHNTKINTLTLTTEIQPTLEPAFRIIKETDSQANIEHLTIISRNGTHLGIPSETVSQVAVNSLTLHSIIPIPQLVHWKVRHLSLNYDHFRELDAHHLKQFLAWELPRIQSLRTLAIKGASIGLLLLNLKDRDEDENNFRLPMLHTIELDGSSPMILQYFKSPVLRRVSIKNHQIDLHRPTLCTDITYFSLQGSMIFFRENDNLNATFFAKLTKLEVLDLSEVPYTLFADAFNDGTFDFFFPRLRALNISRKKDLLGSAVLRFVDVCRSSSDVSSIEELVAVECGIETHEQQILASKVTKCHLDIGRSGHDTDLELSF